MRRIRIVVALLVVAAPFCGALAHAQALPATRPAAESMLTEFDSLRTELLRPEKLGDRDYVQDLQARQRAFAERRADLARRFFEQHPDHPRAGELLTDRWQTVAARDAEGVAREVQQTIDRVPAVPARHEAMYVKAVMHFMGLAGGTREAAKAATDALIAAYPKSPRGPQLLMLLARSSTDAGEKRQLEERVARDFPDSFPARLAGAPQRRATALGQPFELAFDDAITGKRVSVADLKGKVVVIDFWATWCAPCVADMPMLKQLYADHRDAGLEIIGVSLDRPAKDGGLKALKTFVETNAIPWPQYHQGDGWEGPFSSAWGVMELPTIFVVDRAGRLHTMEGQGKLEQLVPKLLEAPLP